MDDITGFIIQFLLVFILILFNGLLSMSELAVVSSRKTRLQQQAEEGSSDAQAALRLVDEPTRFLSTVQVGITLVGTLSGAIGGAALANEFAGTGSAAVGAAKMVAEGRSVMLKQRRL